MKKRAQRNTAIKYLDEALKLESEDCILWPYATHNHGYGVIYINGRHRYVHRLALINRVGEAPIGQPHALHKPLICHNAACFNYKHLRWGSRKDNMRDTYIDGTDHRGTKHPMNKLSEQQVLEIYHDTRPQSYIAKEYGIHQVHVSQIKLGKVWGWLTNNLRSKDYA